MNQLERRIQRVERVFWPKQKSDGSVTWPEFQFLYGFAKKFPNPEAAPPLARIAYRQLCERLPRRPYPDKKIDDPSNESTDD